MSHVDEWEAQNSKTFHLHRAAVFTFGCFFLILYYVAMVWIVVRQYNLGGSSGGKSISSSTFSGRTKAVAASSTLGFKSRGKKARSQALHLTKLKKADKSHQTLIGAVDQGGSRTTEAEWLRERTKQLEKKNRLDRMKLDGTGLKKDD
jgi:hypothetical protein